MVEQSFITPYISELTEQVDVSSFECGDRDLNEFLQRDALDLQKSHFTKAYVAHYEGQIVGYIALLCDNIMLRPEEKQEAGFQDQVPRTIPAVKIGRLAASKTHREQIRGIGTTLMRFAAQQALLLDQIVGCRLLSVDAYSESISFYKKLGFVENTHRLYQGAHRTTVSMRFDLFQETLPEWLNEP